MKLKHDPNARARSMLLQHSQMLIVIVAIAMPLYHLPQFLGFCIESQYLTLTMLERRVRKRVKKCS